MNKYSNDFIDKLRNAHKALTACRIHEEAGPGYKGLQENLWEIAGFESENEFLETIYPGYPKL